MELTAVLAERGLSPAAYAVLFHIGDTVVCQRALLATWVADNLPNSVPTDISVADCLGAIDSLIALGLLVELTSEDIEADLARWRAEAIPVSWGVDRDRAPGDIDLTDAGFRALEEIARAQFPEQSRQGPVTGYNDEAADTIRIFGETEEKCRTQADHVLERIGEPPWRWSSAKAAPMRAAGPWWYSRHRLIPGGFDIIIHRADG